MQLFQSQHPRQSTSNNTNAVKQLTVTTSPDAAAAWLTLLWLLQTIDFAAAKSEQTRYTFSFIDSAAASNKALTGNCSLQVKDVVTDADGDDIKVWRMTFYWLKQPLNTMDPDCQLRFINQTLHISPDAPLQGDVTLFYHVYGSGFFTPRVAEKLTAGALNCTINGEDAGQYATHDLCVAGSFYDYQKSFAESGGDYGFLKFDSFIVGAAASVLMLVAACRFLFFANSQRNKWQASKTAQAEQRATENTYLLRSITSSTKTRPVQDAEADPVVTLELGESSSETDSAESKAAEGDAAIMTDRLQRWLPPVRPRHASP